MCSVFAYFLLTSLILLILKELCLISQEVLRRVFSIVEYSRKRSRVLILIFGGLKKVFKSLKFDLFTPAETLITSPNPIT